jgi:hypothetical protein
MCLPNKGEQMVRYYGYYSNVCRGKHQKAGRDALIPFILEPDEGLKAYRKNWARLIQKIYEVDPLTCPKGVTSTLFGPNLIIDDINLIFDSLLHTSVPDLHVELTSP